MKRIRNDRGQAAVITVMFMATLLWVPSRWCSTSARGSASSATRSRNADAAALASAQALPTDRARQMRLPSSNPTKTSQAPAHQLRSRP